MKRKMYWTNFVLLLFVAQATAQVSFFPVFPNADEPCTITFNPKEGDRGLANWTGDIYMHTGVTTPAGTWQNVKQTTWGFPDPLTKMTRQPDGTYKFSFSPNIRAYYNVASNVVITGMSFVFHNGMTTNTQSGRAAGGGDIFYNDIIQPNSPLRIRIVTPSVSSQLVERNATIPFYGAASLPSKLTLTDNGVQIAVQDSAKELSKTIVAPNTDGTHRLVFKATTVTANSVSDSAVFTYAIAPTVSVANPPAGMELGANVNAAGDSITFLFQAPRKQNVYVIGSFNNYQTDNKYLMSRSVDGNTWWIKIGGLTPGQTYTYQYLVDGALTVADPLSILVLDPNNDSRIPAETYPNPIPYPTGKTTGYVSAITPGKAAYNWQVTNFQRPLKTDLVIYELHIRDFVAKHNFQTLIDTIKYLKNLNINAIELMPVNEFSGNESWGYNPTFHNALDKYYGTPEKFKEFIDLCHKNGIAVICDVVFNHIDDKNTPLAALYINGSTPAADNPWLNPSAPHYYSFFYDMNHESALTKAYVNRCLKYWLQEYRIDGYRFDFTKGFTQKASNNDQTVSAYDQSRIDHLKVYHQTVQQTSPGAYTILEHFAENSEETVLANEGMMVWNNMVFTTNEITMGYTNNAFRGYSAKSRSWNTTANSDKLVSYPESHDEERLMFKNLKYGNASGNYSVKNLKTALRRNEMANAFIYAIPGAKMLWQFGELGYEFSIDSNGRVGNKPIRWDYFADADRRRLYNVTSNMAFLKTSQPLFRTTTYDDTELYAGYPKAFHLSSTDLNVTILGNFNVVAENVVPNFQRTGKWYDYLSGDSITVTNAQTAINMLPGEYHVYTSVKLARPPMGYIAGTTGTQEFTDLVNQFSVYPNPSVSSRIFVGFNLRKHSSVMWEVYNLAGQKITGSALQKRDAGSYQETITTDLPNGVYMVRLSVDGVTATEKLIVQN